MKISALIVSLSCIFASANVMADEALARSKNCMACHSVDKKLVGPAYKDIAAKYKGDEKAVAMLAAKIRAGGSGNWGPIPMPPNAGVSEEEAKKLVEWMLSL